MVDYIPSKGDIVWINFNPQSGHEQAGKRPALVISPYKFNKITGFIICCPITSKIKDYPFEVVVDGKIKGAILSDQIKSLDFRARGISFVEKVKREILIEVIDKIKLVLESE